ncbi:MAG: sugar ABC transporter substrate-binding protein [Limnochordales bacterium]|nr:sugar ABC transporter substrate-binding protein [Limnochordales bacterium]
MLRSGKDHDERPAVYRTAFLAMALFIVVCGVGLGVSLSAGGGAAHAAPQKVSFMFVANPPEYQLWKERVDKFNASRQDIQVTIQWVPGSWDDVHSKALVGIAAGTPPDIVRLHESQYNDWVRAGLLTSLNGFIEDDKYDMNVFFPQIIMPLQVNGQLYGFPQTIATRALAFNKDMLDNAGIKYPDSFWRWEHELLTAARKLTDPSKNRWGIGFWFSTGPSVLLADIPEIIWSFGGDIFTRDDRFVLDSEPARRGIQFLLDLIHRYKVYPPDGSVAHAFWQGRLAMWNTGTWDITSIRSSGVNFDFAPTPGGPKGAYSWVNSALYVIPKGAHADAAWEFIKYLMSYEGQDIFSVRGGSGVPVRKDLISKYISQPSPPNWSTFLISVERGRMPYYPPNQSRILDALSRKWSDLYQGTVSLDAWLDEVKPIVDKLLAEPFQGPQIPR